MTKVVVDAGICGFTTTIEVIRLSSRGVGIRVNSECEMVSKIGVQLREVDWRDVFGSAGDSLVYKSTSVSHTCCLPRAHGHTQGN